MPRTRFANDEERRAYYRERSARTRAKNPDAANRYCAEWRKRNPEKVKRQWASYYEANKDEMQQRGRDYYHLTADVQKARREALVQADPEYYAKKYRRAAKANPAKTLWTSARRNALHKHVAFDIEVADVHVPTHCPVLGIPLVIGEGKMSDGTPTIDRLIPTKGYTKGNIMVVSWRANRLKSDATLADMEALVAFYRPILSQMA